MEFGGNSHKALTIVITTYNRKQPLLEQLQSIEKQGLFDKYNVIVSDNHSDYDVKKWLDANLSDNFSQIVKVISKEYNVGGDMNILSTFMMPDTEWMWLLSDDDVTNPGSIEQVLYDIEAHKDCCWLKYSISPKYGMYDDEEADSISSVFKNHRMKGRSCGLLVFLSNNVYKLPVIRKNYLSACMYNDTCMTQVQLPLLAIKRDQQKVWFSSKNLVTYTPNNGSYNRIYALMRFGNILYSDLYLNRKEIREFKRLTFFPVKAFVSEILNIQNRKQRFEFFKKMYIAHYSVCSLKGLSLFFIYPLMFSFVRLKD